MGYVTDSVGQTAGGIGSSGGLGNFLNSNAGGMTIAAGISAIASIFEAKAQGKLSERDYQVQLAAIAAQLGVNAADLEATFLSQRQTAANQGLQGTQLDPYVNTKSKVGLAINKALGTQGPPSASAASGGQLTNLPNIGGAYAGMEGSMGQDYANYAQQLQSVNPAVPVSYNGPDLGEAAANQYQGAIDKVRADAQAEIAGGQQRAREALQDPALKQALSGLSGAGASATAKPSSSASSKAIGAASGAATGLALAKALGAKGKLGLGAGAAAGGLLGLLS